MNTPKQFAIRQSGVTLVELLIGLAVGILLLFGVGLLFTQNKQSYRQNEELARLQEEARFALDEIGRDLTMAGFMAEIVDSSILLVGNSAADQAVLEGSLDASVNCGPSAATRNWFYDFRNGIFDGAIMADDNVATGAVAQALFSCLDASTFQPGTDLVGIKRTGGVASGVVNLGEGINAPAPLGRMYIRENGSRGVLYQSPDFPTADAGASAERIVPQPFNEWEYTPRIYFVRNFSVTPGDGIPSLCRIRLANTGGAGRPPTHLEECLAQGVEDLQLEFGIDTNNDGAANAYIADPVADDLQRTVSVRIYLLMRTLREDVGYRDNRTYTLSNKPDYTPNDRFHRRIYASTVTVHNVNSARRLGF